MAGLITLLSAAESTPAVGLLRNSGLNAWVVPGDLNNDGITGLAAQSPYQGSPTHDTTPGNNTGLYRSDDVDLQTTSDARGGFKMKSAVQDEWLVYTVNVQAPVRTRWTSA